MSKPNLLGALKANIFARGSVSANKFVAYITDKKNTNKLTKSIWGEKSNTSPGQIHGLVLMLLAANIVELSVVNESKVGTADLQVADVEISLTKVKVSGNDSEYDQLAIHIDDYWNGFNFKP